MKTDHAIYTHLIAAVAATGLAVAGLGTHAQPAEIQTTYSIEKGACDGGTETRVEIAEGRITGPGFDCALSTSLPAGSGLVAYGATCTVEGEKVSGTVALDLGNYDDHFELALPGREGWLELYPCTPVPGLK